MRVCVVGLGKIGLPLAVHVATHGQQVTGCDIDAGLVAALNAGHCPMPDEEGLPQALASVLAAGTFRATIGTAAAVAEADVVTIIVPLLIDGEKQPRFEALDAATAAAGAGLRKGTLVIYETSVPVGTTRTRFGPALEHASGLVAGADFDLAYSPERVFSGRVLTDLRRYPKVAGGTTKAAGERAAAFYAEALGAPTTLVADAETAEFSKLAETTYRDLNIAYANELARTADALGIDVTEAIAAANSQPFSHIHQPGVGVGGHCIPVYPHLLMRAPGEHRLARAGREVNDGMAGYAAGRLAGALGGLTGRSVIVLGLAYRPDVKEAAFSSTFGLARALTERGATVAVHDPLFTAEEIAALGLVPQASWPARADAVIVQAWHRQYQQIGYEAFRECGIVLDGRNTLPPHAIERLGVRYMGIGR